MTHGPVELASGHHRSCGRSIHRLRVQESIVNHSVAPATDSPGHDFSTAAVAIWDESEPPTPAPAALIASAGVRICELHTRAGVESLDDVTSSPLVVLGLDGVSALAS